MRREKVPGLDELAFQGRNKAYGAYDLRKRYPRILAMASVIASVFVALVFVIPFLYYYFDPVLLVEGELFYEAEYYSMMPPPDDPNLLIPSLPKPLPEESAQPVVADSVPPEEVKPIEPTPVKKEEEVKTDTAGKGDGSQGFGPGTGENTGLATVIDVYPRYPGGDESRLYFLRKNIRYPEAAIKAGVQGVVMVVFIIEMDGSLSNVEVGKGIGGGCDEEALRVVKRMPKWEPAKRGGRAVRLMIRMPIVFRIPGK
jgi:periplasmic protein TonB